MILWTLLAGLALAQTDPRLPVVRPKPEPGVEIDDDEGGRVEPNETALPEAPDAPLLEGARGPDDRVREVQVEEDYESFHEFPGRPPVAPPPTTGEVLPRSEFERVLEQMEPVPPLIPVEIAADPSLAPPRPGSEPVDGPTGRIEITVFGPAAIRQARAAIVREMEDMGYRPDDQGGGVVVFRPPRSWMGRVTLQENGELSFRRPVIALRQVYLQERERDHAIRMPPGMEPNPNISRTPAGQVFYEGVLDEGAGVVLPPIEGSVYILPSMRRLRPIQEAVLERLAPYVEQYRQVRANTFLMERLDEVRAQLDALWTRGVPLEGTGRLDTMEQRRRAILDFWSTRLDNREGIAVSAVVEQFLRERVQRSEHPATEDEIRRATSRRADGRPLRIDPGTVIGLSPEDRRAVDEGRAAPRTDESGGLQGAVPAR